MADKNGVFYDQHKSLLELMTLRDYFAAHAPAEPQEWFRPNLRSIDTTTKSMRSINEIKKSDASKDEKQAAILAQRARIAFIKAQTLIQWPYAWADMMIKQRKA